MKKKILLTGSSSFTGSKFMDLYSEDFDITPISRSNADNPVDLNDFESVERLYKMTRPDAVVHLAATIGRDAKNADVLSVDVMTTKHLIDLAKSDGIPFIYTSSEMVYDGRKEGMYREDDDYLPRSEYGQSKVICEQYLKDSNLPYLITRGHRYIGFPSPGFDRPKQFTDAIFDLLNGNYVHANSVKKINPILVNDICDVIVHYLDDDSDKKIILNLGMPEVIRYDQLLKDIARQANIDESLIISDGEEPGWLDNNTLDTSKLRSLGYPQRSYDEVVSVIVDDIKAR